MRFKGRQLTRMANCDIMIDMEHHKHELQQIEVSKSDKVKRDRLLSANEKTRDRVGIGSIGWLVIDHCCPRLPFDYSERRRPQSDATIRDMLKLNNMRRSAKSVGCKLRIRSFPINQPRLMGVRDAAHANVEGGASQQACVILEVYKV